jgi:hypothetical protein
MFLFDSLIVNGIRFVLDKVAHAVDSEVGDVDRLREELLAAHSRFDLGEIDADELAAVEARVIPLLREARREAADAIAGMSAVGADVRFVSDDDDE